MRLSWGLLRKFAGCVSLMMLLSITNSVSGQDTVDWLELGCKVGVAIGQEALGKTSKFERQRMDSRCVGGIIRRPNIRKEYEADPNKDDYACGLGIGVAVGFYNKKDLLKDIPFMSKTMDICLRDVESIRGKMRNVMK